MSITTRHALILLTLLLTLAPSALAREDRPPVSFGLAEKGLGVSLDAVALRAMPAVDNGALAAKADLEMSQGLGGPFIFAHPFTVSLEPTKSGSWETLADDTQLWRLRVRSPGAMHLNFGFRHFDLPPGASLWIYNRAGDHVRGPYTAADRSPQGELWTPIIFGDEAVIELHLPAGGKASAGLELSAVNHGFRFIAPKQGACNNDVVCPEGDPWRAQIRSVGWYTRSGVGTCSGQLVNNTAEDDRPFFLSAHHCGVDDSNADSIVVYWNFQSPVCGQLSGGTLDDNQSGAIFRASDVASDFLLFELQDAPAASSNVYFSGWNVSGDVPQSAVGIHHPSLDEKAISFDNDPLISVDIGNGPDTHWQVEAWDDGTTEGGSSGSCIWDPVDMRCVGVLTGGFASCSAPEQFDVYGKLSVAWGAGLQPWLDPGEKGATELDGKEPGDGGGGDGGGGDGEPGGCVPSRTVLCLHDDRFQVELNWTDFAARSQSAQVAGAASADSGIFWFYDPANWEVLVKVLDGCAHNGSYWVFTGNATNLGWDLTVTDTTTGTVFRRSRPVSDFSVGTTEIMAFATCP